MAARHQSSNIATWLLLLANVGPTGLCLLQARWPWAPLLYCGGNLLWIAQLGRRTAPDKDGEATLASVWIPVLLMTVAALSWAWLSQPATTLNGGFGWDGKQYAEVYSYFASPAYSPAGLEFPYSQRIGLPFLAAHMPFSPRESFLLLHAAFWSATMVLFGICARRCFGLSRPAIYLGVLWLQILWISIPRGTANYSFTVDSAALFFMQAWIFLLLIGRWRWLLPVVALTGVLFKETILLLVLISWLAIVGMWTVPRLRRRLPADLSTLRSPAFAVLALALLAAGLGRWMASSVVPHGRLLQTDWLTMQDWFAIRTQDPVQILRYVAATFSAYGGFALLWVATLGKSSTRERRFAVTFAAALCPLYFAICFVAGSDLTRFALMAFPFALPILLAQVDEVSPQFVALALLLGLPAAHAFTPIAATLPGYGMPHGDLEGLYSWLMEYAHPAVVGSWMAWWLGSILVLRSVGFSSTWKPELARRTMSGGQDVGRSEGA